ncbi:MAG: redoxin family protein [Capsulimonadales bacterium]|nr:redoxin family protein [Capsulimonadales bacterium]
MKRRTLLAALTAMILAAGVRPVFAGELNVGDTAPKIEVKEWIKGEPVTAFESGKIYVVEFWATWCGPCRTSIPHLTQLQKKYPNVRFIGVSVWENDQSRVKPFVAEMGEKMNYTVASDIVPEGGNGNAGAMAKNWMTAAAQNGIPTAFVVNGEGKVAWIGHPMTMDKPLADIVEGKWDVTKAAEEFRTRAAMERKMQAIGADYSAATKDGDFKKAVSVLDAAIAEDPKMETTLGNAKYSTLIRSGDAEAADGYLKRLVTVVFKDDPDQLNSIAWGIVDPAARRKPTKNAQAMALTAAKRANELTGGKKPEILDTLAKAYFDNGDRKNALATQEKAVAYAKGTAMEGDAEIAARLEMYRKAVKP